MTTTPSKTSDPLGYADHLMKLASDTAKLEALEQAFTRVEYPGDWKAPIDWTGWLDSKQAALTIEAIDHYTATPARIRYLSAPGRSGWALVRITAKGYRAGPAGDH